MQIMLLRPAIRFFACVLLISAVPALLNARDGGVLFREDFASLDDWEPYNFPKIKKHSVYSIVPDGGKHVLKTESNASASALVYKKAFNVFEYPNVRWRWKVSNIYKNADARTKKGDDYPLRVYIMFEYDPDSAGTFEKMKYGLLKSIYGQYPPLSSLNYVWANKDEAEKIITSPYTDRAKMVLLEAGASKIGRWLDEKVDMVDDYQKAFGSRPPALARIAVMNDSDNTGESSVSYLEYIEVYK